MSKIKCTLNNRLLENKRKDQLYQAIMVDLYLVGVIEKEKAEALLGYEIPDYLSLPKNIAIKVQAINNRADTLQEPASDSVNSEDFNEALNDVGEK